MKWLNRWFSFSWKKLVLVAALVPLMWYCQQTDFPRVKSFIKDALQFLNDPAEVDTSFVTVNINGKVDTFTRPFTLETFTSVIDKIRSYKPKHIILCFSQKEFRGEEIKKGFFKYIEDKKEIYLQADYVNPEDNLARNPVFENFARFVIISSSTDTNQGARDRKPRRLLLSYDKEGPADEYLELKNLGYNPKELNYFKFGFKLWETDQIYFKSYKAGAFGSYDAQDLLNNIIDGSNFTEKTILLGSFDEFSFSGLPSVFNFSDKISGDNFKTFYFPHVDNLANILNTYTTGNYIKTPKNFNDLLITFIILSILICIKIPSKTKLFISLSIIPLFLILATLTYVFSSFFLDFSRSIVLIFFLQYLGIPIIMFSMFKEQETKKLQEIGDARIDALLTVSEKVAHDIRSPLSAINLVMHKVKFDDPEYKEIFDSAVQRIDETATKILTRYRTKTGSENEAVEQIDLAEIISSITKEKKILNTKVEFEFVINSESTTAMGLKLDLERILSNILDNSIFALQSILEPRIFISIDSHNDMIRVGITDNGTGIPEQVLKLLGTARITTKADTNQGNGIGILHAKRVIERLNGRFEISSAEHVGTTIKISLPKA